VDQAYKTEWQRRHRQAFREANGYSTTCNYGAGGNRSAVLERDGHACVQCGMTDEQHKAKWNRPITVDHISKDRSDNSLSNLQTLCLTCHGRKDLIPRLRARKAEPLVPEMKRLRAAGKTYQSIADELGLSVGSVWKYLTGKMS
jgi:hypothetical protein